MTPEPAGDRQRRILVVRCPAWPAPDQVPNRRQAQTASRRKKDLAEQRQETPEARAFEQVVNAIGEFCPRLEVLRPGICAFSVRGVAGYFGGEADLAEKIIETVRQLGFDCGIGIADGLFAALLASRDALIAEWPAPPEPIESIGGGGSSSPPGRRPRGLPSLIEPPVVIAQAGATPAFLAPRSVRVLGEPDLADLLMRLGIRTLGDFAALPAAEAENRFGPQGFLAHRLASGLDPRPLAARPPSNDLSVQIEFDPPAELAEQVIFAAKSLADELHASLAAAGLACIRLQVQVICADGQEITRLWRHDGLLTELAVAERVRWQLDGWQAGRATDDPGTASTDQAGNSDDNAQAGGIAFLRLVPDQLVRQRGRQLALWGDSVITDRVARAAVRVQAMLGHEAVQHPVLAGGRSPADRAVLIPFGDARPEPARPADQPWPGQIPAPAPATVYPLPRSATVTDAAGTPVTVTGRGEVSADPICLSVSGGPPLAITAWTGPWPITERWWDPVQACRKARFQLVTVDGSAWLAVVKEGRWLIEASYD
jgi:protein ImuB